MDVLRHGKASVKTIKPSIKLVDFYQAVLRTVRLVSIMITLKDLWISDKKNDRTTNIIA